MSATPAQKPRRKSTRKAENRKAFTPVFGSLDDIGDPFKRSSQKNNDAFFDGAAPAYAMNDYTAATKFLFSYNGSTATFNAYRRELERLFQWAWRVEMRAVMALSRDDIEAFVRFCLNPPDDWIGEKNVARFITENGERRAHPDWRPFVLSNSKSAPGAKTVSRQKRYQPSQAAIRSIFAVLSSFYDYLTEESLIDHNPVALIRQKSKFIKKDHNAAPVRRISNLQWDYVIDTAAEMADSDPSMERSLFIMNCLFAMYLRISELVVDERSTPLMSDFRKDQDGNWWFHVTGKGNKDRTIAVSDDMLAALKRYRTSRHLSPLPALGDPSPLIVKSRGDGAISSTRQVRRIVQECFDAAYDRMKRDGLEEDAQDLKAATVHWLRHTGISEDVKIRPREHVRDDAGHASMATTDRYIESDRRERHRSGKKKPLKDL